MDIEPLASLLAGRAVVALTGAGISTESGIPDYRGDGARHRKRPPMQIREFLGSEAARTRYWARSFAGWPRFSSASPNAGHVALAQLEAHGFLRGVITQNVDRLHQRAGSRRVVELHGALAEVRCLGCEQVLLRSDLQERLSTLNDGLVARDAAALADGDAELEPAEIDAFRTPVCDRCGGVLKPNVVFFGENVPPPWARAAWTLYEEAEVLLVVGSSLTVFSGFRFVRRAAEEARAIAIVNVGPTRGDALAGLKLEAPSGEILPRLASALLGTT